jgi:hypothetical protein
MYLPLTVALDVPPRAIQMPLGDPFNEPASAKPDGWEALKRGGVVPYWMVCFSGLFVVAESWLEFAGLSRLVEGVFETPEVGEESAGTVWGMEGSPSLSVRVNRTSFQRSSEGDFKGRWKLALNGRSEAKWLGKWFVRNRKPYKRWGFTGGSLIRQKRIS